MRFLKSKLWGLAILLALFGQFSPLAARFCSMTQSSVLCAESPSENRRTKIDEICESLPAISCSQCCEPPDSLVALLQSAPLISSARQELLIPSVEIAILPALVGCHTSPDFIVCLAIFREIDLPPPLKEIGSTISCRAPPVEV
jgi:hypothetical protein